MLDEQYRQGQVTEQTLTRCGFQADTDWDGTCAGSRPDGGSAEHMQRAKCLTHEHQVRLREEVRERAQAQKQKREADARMKAQNLVLLNQQCEGLLVNAVSAGILAPRMGAAYNPSVRDVGKASMLMFSEIKADMLTGFIFVRENASEKGKAPRCKKGTVEEATANLEPTLIRRAYDLRHSKPILRHLSNDGSDAASDARASSSLNAQRPVPAPLSVVCEPVYSASEWRLASSLLDDHQWADAVREELGEGVCVKGPTTAWARPKGVTLVPFVLHRKAYDVMVCFMMQYNRIASYALYNRIASYALYCIIKHTT